jgi:hypothetical protein
MNTDAKIIALVVDESATEPATDSLDSTGTHRLMREADGSVTLEPIESEEEFRRMAKDTGCFRRGRAIRDPKTSEVIGYEMEETRPETPIASR